MDLFYDADGKLYTDFDVRNALREIGACDCNVLFVHSDIMFGSLVKVLKRKDYLQCLYDCIASNNVNHIIVPTFTYSFCNSEDFDVINSRTSMGALNEYIRCLNNRYRTIDPLLSFSVPAELKDKFSRIGSYSLGSDSCFDRLHNLPDVKFLFFGARMGNCFTYVHHIEKMLDVEYRFDMPFIGNILFPDGTSEIRKQYIHTACYGVKPADFYYFEDELEINGILKKAILGNKTISCISEKDAYYSIEKKISGNKYYFLEQPYTAEDLEHRYTKGLDGERITHC